MKKTKRLWSILLAGTMLFSLTACTGNGGAETESSASQSQESSQPESSAAEEPSASEPESSVTAAENGDILVVYYSATGNTEQAAEYIAEVTGGDLFELEPAEPYTDEDLNWTDDNSRVSQEYADESLRDVELVSTTVENWDSYDTVYIGYPIWWGIAAWPVNGFVSANDFTGKTVIPFATSSSSGMGESGELLAELAGTGDWQEGQRFSSGVSETDVTEWVNNLGITE
ncbi:MAG TPA: flavodoxin [Candidatus Merdivicinus excrementipullorum]|uniref:Flavodoxin n=1 Tax=Candidatus Merdivicinus excrementipullorum TaxID=2840867 RepID=A0A9D1FM50_9FIRM|nr:flavodoxin [Candidatus Merdivicinus excrementipullorum]